VVLSDEAEFLYTTTDYWYAASVQRLIWNDPILNIKWPNLDDPPIFNTKNPQGLS
jgi:dTDP-4-dehydrorhamnose 3,5-epimerase